MTLEDIIRALAGNNGDPEAAAYLRDPSSNPAVDRVQPYPSSIPLTDVTIGPDGRRLPLPRIQGGMMPPAQVEVRTRHPAMYNRLVFGPGAGAGANEPLPPPRQPMGPGAPVMRFSDATRQVGPEMVDQPMQPVAAPWTQPVQIEAGPAVSENRLPIGAPPLQIGLEPPSAPQQPMDDEADWNAALARVRANMGSDPTGLRAERERELGRLRGRARRAEMVASAPDRYNWPRTIR